jgi:predicted dehydrogenase
MNLLIVGCGMYVTGRGGTGMGTILASVMQAFGDDDVHSITICATSPANADVVAEASRRLGTALGLSMTIPYAAYDGTTAGLVALARDRKIHAAIVSTPDPCHFEQVRILIDSGIHCLCVKPLVSTVAEHTILAELAADRGVHAAVEFHKRWDESNLHVRKVIQEGRLGKLHNISVDYSQRIMIPTEVFAGWTEQTNIFQYLGIHYVDLVQWLTDSVPVRLCCHGTEGILKEYGFNTWDSVHVWLIWQRGNGEEFLSQFNLSWVDSNRSPALSDQRFSILGSLGRYDVDQRNRGISSTLHNESIQFINPWFSELLPSPDGTLEMQGYGYKSIAQFLKDCQAVLNGEITAESLVARRPTFKDCIESTRVIECVNSCLKKGVQGFVDL